MNSIGSTIEQFWSKIVTAEDLAPLLEPAFNASSNSEVKALALVTRTIFLISLKMMNKRIYSETCNEFLINEIGKIGRRNCSSQICNNCCKVELEIHKLIKKYESGISLCNNTSPELMQTSSDRQNDSEGTKSEVMEKKGLILKQSQLDDKNCNSSIIKTNNFPSNILAPETEALSSENINNNISKLKENNLIIPETVALDQTQYGNTNIFVSVLEQMNEDFNVSYNKQNLDCSTNEEIKSDNVNLKSPILGKRLTTPNNKKVTCLLNTTLHEETSTQATPKPCLTAAKEQHCLIDFEGEQLGNIQAQDSAKYLTPDSISRSPSLLSGNKFTPKLDIKSKNCKMLGLNVNATPGSKISVPHNSKVAMKASKIAGIDNSALLGDKFNITPKKKFSGLLNRHKSEQSSSKKVLQSFTTFSSSSKLKIETKFTPSPKNAHKKNYRQTTLTQDSFMKKTNIRGSSSRTNSSELKSKNIDSEFQDLEEAINRSLKDKELEDLSRDKTNQLEKFPIKIHQQTTSSAVEGSSDEFEKDLFWSTPDSKSNDALDHSGLNENRDLLAIRRSPRKPVLKNNYILQNKSDKILSCESEIVSLSPIKKSLSPIKKSLSPIKKSLSPIKKSLSPIKKSLSPIKKSLSPIKKVNLCHESDVENKKMPFDRRVDCVNDIEKKIQLNEEEILAHLSSESQTIDIPFQFKKSNITPKKKSKNKKHKSSEIEDSFNILPLKADEPGFAYKGSVIRKKHEKHKVDGWDCHECRDYYQAKGLTEEQKKVTLNKVSSHRSKYRQGPSTPEGFWNADWNSVNEGCESETQFNSKSPLCKNKQHNESYLKKSEKINTIHKIKADSNKSLMEWRDSPALKEKKHKRKSKENRNKEETDENLCDNANDSIQDVSPIAMCGNKKEKRKLPCFTDEEFDQFGLEKEKKRKKKDNEPESMKKQKKTKEIGKKHENKLVYMLPNDSHLKSQIPKNFKKSDKTLTKKESVCDKSYKQSKKIPKGNSASKWWDDML